jgi:two-component system LytT family response regulator
MSETVHIPRKCLIVDDEPPAREVIKRYIEQVPLLELTGECANAIEAMTLLQHQPADLIFLDIRMPQLNGTDFLKTLKSAPGIILTTAFAEYALESYELDVVDYLLKPVRFDRFLRAVNKAFPTQGSNPIPGNETPSTEKKTPSFVYFRADRKMIKVLLRDLLYIESMRDYVKVVTTDATIITKQSISSVEGMLPERLFVRTHRSFIVSIAQIHSFTPESIELGNATVPIGKLYRNGVLKMLEQA